MKIKRIVLLSVFLIILTATIACFAYEETQFVPVDTSGHAYLELAMLRLLAIFVIIYELNLFLTMDYFAKYGLKGNKIRTIFNIIMLVMSIVASVYIITEIFGFSYMAIGEFAFIGIAFVRIIYCVVCFYIFIWDFYQKHKEKSEKAIDKQEQL